MNGFLGGASPLKIKYSVTITDFPYLTESTEDGGVGAPQYVTDSNGNKVEGTPVYRVEVRETQSTVQELVSLLTTKLAFPISGSEIDLFKNETGTILRDESFIAADKRREVSLALPVSVYGSVAGGYSVLSGVSMGAVSQWKTIICNGGRRATLSETAEIQIFRSGSKPVSEVDAGDVILCSEDGELELAVILLAERSTHKATGYAITTQAGSFDTGGITIR